MQTCNIMGVNIAVTDMDKTLRLVEDNCEAWRGKYICVANVHTTVTAHDDPTYLRVQNGAVIAGMYSPPFRSLTADEDAEIVEKINAAKPDFVWVGLGAPKQERWMAAHENRVQALMLGVGAAFDYEAGNIRRAPAWMQRCNLEWLYRLMQDPKRLFKRYFVTNTKFLWWSWRH